MGEKTKPHQTEKNERSIPRLGESEDKCSHIKGTTATTRGGQATKGNGARDADALTAAGGTIPEFPQGNTDIIEIKESNYELGALRMGALRMRELFEWERYEWERKIGGLSLHGRKTLPPSLRGTK